MADPFIAEIRILPLSFAPLNWAWCDGQLMSIQQNTALFSLLGNIYGGDGKTTFALPNLQGRAPMHPGQGPGLTLRHLGEMGGSETVTLVQSQMPVHNHQIGAQTVPLGSTTNPTGNTLTRPASGNLYDATSPTPVQMSSLVLGPSGGDGGPHNNMMPYLTVNFCIALSGLYPVRP